MSANRFRYHSAIHNRARSLSKRRYEPPGKILCDHCPHVFSAPFWSYRYLDFYWWDLLSHIYGILGSQHVCSHTTDRWASIYSCRVLCRVCGYLCCRWTRTWSSVLSLPLWTDRIPLHSRRSFHIPNSRIQFLERTQRHHHGYSDTYHLATFDHVHLKLRHLHLSWYPVHLHHPATPRHTTCCYAVGNLVS
jgi:hypothetical protein